MTPLDDVQVERPAPGTAVVVFSGEHDLATRSAVRELLHELVADNQLVVVDFSEATFVDSSVLGALLEVNAEAGKRDRIIRLQLGTADIVRRSFEIVGVLSIMEVFHTREAALEDPQ